MRFGIALLGCLALTAAACATVDEPKPEEEGELIVLGMTKHSEDGLMTATLTQATPLPPAQGLNSWTVDISNADGPVLDEGDADSEVIANIFMVEHDHNVRKLGTMIEPGVFEIADFALTMNGYWEVTVEVWLDVPANGDDQQDAVDDHKDAVFGFHVRN